MKTNFTLLFMLVTLLASAQQRTTINQAISVGVDGVVCVGAFVDKDNAATPSTIDYSRLVSTVGVGCTQWLRGNLDGAATPGDYAGFRIRTTSLVDLLSCVTVATYNGTTRMESRNGGSLLSMLTLGEGYIYFKTSLPHNAVQIEIGGVVTALFTTDIYVGFSQATLPQTVLPLKFGALQAKKQAGNNTLSWSLAGDENISRIQVEKSADGQLFNPIADVALNTSGNYQFNDASVTAQQYYRVKATTTFGRVYTSNIATIYAGVDGAFVVQNPIQGSVSIQTNHTKPVSIYVHNSSGQVVKQATKSGGGQYSINLSGAAAGLYMVSVYDGQKLIQQSRVVNM